MSCKWRSCLSESAGHLQSITRISEAMNVGGKASEGLLFSSEINIIHNVGFQMFLEKINNVIIKGIC